PLRLHLAETLLTANKFGEAQLEFEKILESCNDERARFGLARVFYQLDEFAKCSVVLEELLDAENSNIDYLILYVRALVRENEIEQAIGIYRQILDIQPGFSDPELDSQLRLPDTLSSIPAIEDELSPFVEKPSINFEDVGGMDEVKKEIEMKIIHPLKHPDLYKAYGKKTGGGMLLYGPPGCGKTFIAQATAGQVNARFITIGLNDILDMWIGSSEKNLHGIFEVARDHAPCVLFFDEIDALGASRSDMRQSSGRHLINQFLQELDGMDNNNEGVLILGATNTPWHLDSAFRRPGRFDRIIFVPPPDLEARASIIELKLKGKPLANIDYSTLAKKTNEFSGADIEAIIDIAIEEKLSGSFADGIPRPIETKDLLNAITKHKASTREWFITAKNFALYANDSGLYDDILKYMNIKK
ncbi:MAG: AAA family ATPase, partial [Marinoscillum sp.]